MFLMYLPFWVHEGGPGAFLERLRDPSVRKCLHAEPRPRMGEDLTTMVITSVGANEFLRGYEGRSLAWVMEQRGQSDALEVVCDLLLETELAIGFVAHGGSTE